MPITQAAYRRRSGSGEESMDRRGGQSLRVSRLEALSICSTNISRFSKAVSLVSEVQESGTCRQVIMIHF